MLESLVCPNCSAPLTFSAAAADSMECPYCHTKVLVTDRKLQASDSGRSKTPAAAPSVNGKVALFLAFLGVAILTIILAVIDSQSHSPTASSSPGSAPGKLAFASKTLEFGSKGLTPGHFQRAEFIAVDPKGHIFVGERLSDSSRVQIFDASGKYLSEFLVANKSASFDDLVAGRDGTLYAVLDGKICRFNSLTGDPLPDMEREMVNNFGSQTPEYYRCACLTGTTLHAITGYAVDIPHIVDLSIATGKINHVTIVTPPAGVILNLRRILTLTTGEIFGLDPEKGAIFKFSAAGAFINQFGGAGSEEFSINPPPAQLDVPSSLATDSQGRIYVGNGNGIKVYDRDGNFIDTFGGDEYVEGLAIDDQDNIYACLMNSVRKYALNR